MNLFTVDIMNIKDNKDLRKKISIISSRSWNTLSPVFEGSGGYKMAYAQNGYSEASGFLTFDETDREILYPSANALGCSFDTSLAESVAVCVGEDLRSEGVNLAVISHAGVKREPLPVKNAYTYSEDILHSTLMCEAFARGIKKRGVGVVLDMSSFAGGDISSKRQNAIIDKRAMKEIYEYDFKGLIGRVKPLGIIIPDGSINGKNLYDDEKNADTFRRSSGFGGILFLPEMSGVDPVKAVNAGILPKMTNSPANTAKNIAQAYEKGEIKEKKIISLADKVTGASKSLRSMAKIRLMHDKEVNYSIANKAARDCFVLLKNDGILPLEKGGKINIIGKNAEAPFDGIIGRYWVNSVKKPFTSMAEKYSGVSYLGDYSEVDIYSDEIKDSEDVFILFMGNSSADVHEYMSIQPIPEDQIALLKNLRETGKKIIAIITSPNTPAIDFSGYADAIIYDPVCGEASSEALAEIIFGIHSPSGRLNQSIPFCIEDHPGYKYSSSGVNNLYKESSLVGYRYFTLDGKKAAYPFGHGLTYSSFEYSSFSCTYMGEDGYVDVSFNVKNTGDTFAKEVVQVYVRDIDKRIYRPGRELRYFEKVSLMPGEEKRISLRLGRKDFCFYDIDKNEFNLASSEYAIDIAASSEDVRISIPITILSDEKYHGKYSRKNVPSYYPENGKRLSVSNHEFFMICRDNVYVAESGDIDEYMSVKDARAKDRLFDELVTELYVLLEYLEPKKSKGDIRLDKYRNIKMLLIENMSLGVFSANYRHLLSRPKKMSEALRIVFGE